MQICKSTFKANLFKHTPTNYVKQRCSENIFPQNDFLRYIMLLQCNFCTCLILSLFCIYLFHAVVGTNYEWHNFLFAFHHYQIAFHLPNQRDLRPLTLVSSKYHYPSHWSLCRAIQIKQRGQFGQINAKWSKWSQIWQILRTF